MRFSDYQRKAYRTANKNLTGKEKIFQAVFGLVGEIGELTEILKKWAFQGHTLPSKLVIEKELGDVLWYLALLATVLDIDLEVVAIENIGKLKRRYPDGFNAKDSIERKE